MANPGDIFLGLSGAEILLDPLGRTFRKRIREGAREGRTVNGRLIKDVQWRKFDFILSYSLISGDTLALYEQLWNLETELSFRWVDSSGADSTYTVQMAPFDARRVVLISDGLWSGVTIELSEV